MRNDKHLSPVWAKQIVKIHRSAFCLDKSIIHTQNNGGARIKNQTDLHCPFQPGIYPTKNVSRADPERPSLFCFSFGKFFFFLLLKLKIHESFLGCPEKFKKPVTCSCDFAENQHIFQGNLKNQMWIK